ncbi:MAG TPA: hypothetical protein VKA69_07560 [Desulfobacteria bacterium]|nr:hypothetical protein [Desulfobacteria bacterium]
MLSMFELSEACKVLFGPEVVASVDFLKYLQPEGLKSAYRKKALETHPDRSNTFQKSERHMNDRFIEATLAYHKLRPLVGGNTLFQLEKRRKETAPGQKKTKRKEDFSGPTSTKNIPKRKLLIGQFLYYSGLISWQTLIDAIVWQRKQRPRIGEIALEWKMLSGKDVQRILQWKSLNEKFGERAVILGYLNRFELMALLGKQRNLNYPLGEYFVRHKILRVRELEFMVERHLTHNIMVAQNKKRP